jgi:EAL domain-containing protein (putative c-di-GMP-specific phosphodiesterase class I)
VLVRWRHPRRGLLAPADFLDAVEHSELALGLTRHVLDMAVGVAASWAQQGIGAPVSVNLGARCMRDPQLPERVLAMLASHNVAAHRLILEVTERVSEVEYEMVEPVLVALRAAGVQISLDDFGTGAASLAFLTRFALDEVKIDRAFVAAMADSPETAAIIRATVDLAHELGLRVVAEGVEHDAQRVALALLGVAAAQGFLFHRPMSVAEATEVMRGSALAR